MEAGGVEIVGQQNGRRLADPGDLGVVRRILERNHKKAGSVLTGLRTSERRSPRQAEHTRRNSQEPHRYF
jgi:hypothetical protein